MNCSALTCHFLLYFAFFYTFGLFFSTNLTIFSYMQENATLYQLLVLFLLLIFRGRDAYIFLKDPAEIIRIRIPYLQ